MNEFLQELQSSARQVMQDAGTPAKHGATWPLMVELGWLLAPVPESLEGLGLGPEAVCVLQQELGRNLAEVPFISASLALDALCQGGANNADWIARFTCGDIATAALVDTQPGRQPISVAGSGAQSTFSGQLDGVPGAEHASHVLVWDEQQTAVALLALDQGGTETQAQTSWDATQGISQINLQQATLEGGALLAQGGAAQDLIARLLNLRDMALAADALGGAAALLELTVEHLQTRQQFGRPLALFQSLKHRCADLKTDIAAAEALFSSTLSQACGDLGSADAILAGQKAKSLASATYDWVAEESLQLHGGIGMASEYPCHLYLKRSMLGRHLGTGNGDYQLAIAEQFLASDGV